MAYFVICGVLNKKREALLLRVERVMTTCGEDRLTRTYTRRSTLRSGDFLYYAAALPPHVPTHLLLDRPSAGPTYRRVLYHIDPPAIPSAPPPPYIAEQSRACGS